MDENFEHYREVALFSDKRLIVAGDFDIFSLTETERRLISDITDAIERYELSKVTL